LLKLGRALLLYWLIYAFDFGTSAFFIAMGYGFAETNQAQRALLTAPGVGSLLSWVINQNIWIALGAIGILGYLVPRVPTRRLHLSLLLMLLSFLRLYGTATNVGFTLQTVLGLSLFPLGYYAILSAILSVALRRHLKAYAQVVLDYAMPSRRHMSWQFYGR
jgi:hypothetical protein